MGFESRLDTSTPVVETVRLIQIDAQQPVRPVIVQAPESVHYNPKTVLYYFDSIRINCIFVIWNQLNVPIKVVLIAERKNTFTHNRESLLIKNEGE